MVINIKYSLGRTNLPSILNGQQKNHGKLNQRKVTFNHNHSKKRIELSLSSKKESIQQHDLKYEEESSN